MTIETPFLPTVAGLREPHQLPDDPEITSFMRVDTLEGRRLATRHWPRVYRSADMSTRMLAEMLSERLALHLFNGGMMATAAVDMDDATTTTISGEVVGCDLEHVQFADGATVALDAINRIGTE